MKPYKTAVVIGRFQPFHNGHAALIDKALEVAQHVVVILGSSFAARNCKNPFTSDERREMIEAYVAKTYIHPTAPRHDCQRLITVVPMRDYYYSDALWVTDLQTKVRRFGSGRTCLVGFNKDESSYYLNLFPSWDFVAHNPDIKDFDNNVLGATAVRMELFSGIGGGAGLEHLYVPPTTLSVLERFRRTAEFRNLRDQYVYLREYPKQWGTGPFVTVDAVVTKAGHVLVVKRGQVPGKGLLAVPGGFLDPKERLIDGAVRELQEETVLSIYTPAELKRRIVGSAVFDHPNRSERGRTITHAFHFNLDTDGETGLPGVTGADDAEEAFWMPLYEVLERPDLFYEDHQAIITHFVLKQ